MKVTVAVSPVIAREYAREHASRMFAGRKGHGGPAQSRLLDRKRLEAELARAFSMGAKFGEGVAEVRS